MSGNDDQKTAKEGLPTIPIQNLEALKAQVSNLSAQLSATAAAQSKPERKRAFWIPFLSIVVALTGVLSGMMTQMFTVMKQEELKHYEVTFNTKQQGYADILSLAEESLSKSIDNDRNYVQSLSKLWTAFYSVEPFFRSEDEVFTMRRALRDISSLCQAVYQRPKGSNFDIGNTYSRFNEIQAGIRGRLKSELFYR